MAMDIRRGAGSLRACGDEAFVTPITYQLWEKPSAEGAPKEWWGASPLTISLTRGSILSSWRTGEKEHTL
jgi:hypothetical protein